MSAMGTIEQQRKDILEQMSAVRSMERATLNEQMLPVKHKDAPEPVLRGPYYVLVRREDGKSLSRRVPKDEVEQVKQDVANCQRFRALSKEYEKLTEQLGRLEREAGASEEALKKGLKSPSSKTRK